MVGLADLGRFILNQYNATKFNQRTAKSQLVAELGPVQPQLVLLILHFNWVGTNPKPLRRKGPSIQKNYTKTRYCHW